MPQPSPLPVSGNEFLEGCIDWQVIVGGAGQKKNHRKEGNPNSKTQIPKGGG